jgi:hypothetical protein
MTLITLSELSQLIQQESVDFLVPQSTDLSSISSLSQQFQLIVRQKRLELSVEPILRQYPLLEDWIRQLETFILAYSSLRNKSISTYR